jgi:hypothetical protein
MTTDLIVKRGRVLRGGSSILLKMGHKDQLNAKVQRSKSSLFS